MFNYEHIPNWAKYSINVSNTFKIAIILMSLTNIKKLNVLTKN